jgi:hypothetical protein
MIGLHLPALPVFRDQPGRTAARVFKHRDAIEFAPVVMNARASHVQFITQHARVVGMKNQLDRLLPAMFLQIPVKPIRDKGAGAHAWPETQRHKSHPMIFCRFTLPLLRRRV